MAKSKCKKMLVHGPRERSVREGHLSQASGLSRRFSLKRLLPSFRVLLERWEYRQHAGQDKGKRRLQEGSNRGVGPPLTIAGRARGICTAVAGRTGRRAENGRMYIGCKKPRLEPGGTVTAEPQRCV